MPIISLFRLTASHDNKQLLDEAEHDIKNYSDLGLDLLLHTTINNYWMRLSMISRIIQTSVNVIRLSVRRITLTEV